MIASLSPQPTSAGLIGEEPFNLFEGPTLLQVAARFEDNVFTAVHPVVTTSSVYYPRYIECKEFAKRVYQRKYKNESYVSRMTTVEPHDKHSVFVYSLDRRGFVNGTLRLCSDSCIGLPMADDVTDAITAHRSQGLLVAEPGRFATCKSTSRRLISAAYAIARYSGVDIYMMQCRADHQDFYESQCGAKVLAGFPAPEHCVNMAWRISETPDLFFKRFGDYQNSLVELLSTLENYNE